MGFPAQSILLFLTIPLAPFPRATSAWERTADEAKRGVLTEIRARRVLSDILEQTSGVQITSSSVRDYFREWVHSRQQEKANRTYLKYGQVSEHFIASLGSRAALPLAAIVTADISAWRDRLVSEGRSSTTTNASLKIVSSVFEKARRGGRIPINPCHELGALKDRSQGKRDTFTMEQLQAILLAAEGSDWKGATLMGFFTGLRLQDVTNLLWESVDTANPSCWLIRVVTSKTGREVAVPVHPELRAWLESQPRGIGKKPVFPSLAGKSGSGRSGLSMQFKRLMQRADVRGKMLRQGSGAGRTTFSLSFHSLRHSFTSAMTAAGVSEEVRMMLTGHTTKSAHRVYSHLELGQVWSAIAAIPRVL